MNTNKNSFYNTSTLIGVIAAIAGVIGLYSINLPDFFIAVYYKELYEEMNLTYVLTVENILIFVTSLTILICSPLIRSIAKDVLEKF